MKRLLSGIRSLALIVFLSLLQHVIGQPAIASLSLAPATATNAELAAYYAPVWRQLTSSEAGYDYLADFITRFDYDGDWRGINNWDNLYNTLIQRDFKAYVYYAVTESETHWFITYAIFHPRDWGEGFTDKCTGGLTCHENDMEGAVVVVKKDGTQYGQLQLTETLSHWWLLPYARDRNLRAGWLPVKAYIDDYQLENGSRVKLCVERRGHGVQIYTTVSCDPASTQMIYRYKNGVPEQPESRNDPDVGYALIELGNSELWHRRGNFGDNEPFAWYGTFRGDKSGNPDLGENKANAPWGWDMNPAGIDSDGVPSGWIFTNPAWAIERHLEGLGSFSTVYIFNLFCVDANQNSCQFANQPPPPNPAPNPNSPPPQPQTDNATFIANVTIPDGTTVSPNQSLQKTWKVRNSGTSTWSGFKLIFLQGDQMGGTSPVNIPTTSPGQEVNITVSLQAPNTSGNNCSFA